MSFRFVLQGFFILLAIAVISFDRHLAYYCPGEITSFILDGTSPAHSDLPVKAYDYHEDITLKFIPPGVPYPLEITVHDYQIFRVAIYLISQHTVWQPPEYTT